MADIREKLRIEEEDVAAINHFLLMKNNPLIDTLLEIVDKYGGVDEINRRAGEAQKIENLMNRLEKKNSPFEKDIRWLSNQRDDKAFVGISDYRTRILGERAASLKSDMSLAVTLEISALNFFPWLIEEAKKAIAQQDLMPARYIRVRSMKEQVEDDDILALAAAMQAMGSSYVQTLDTKGTMLGPDGGPVNIHLGGPETITGYFGGVGVPNDYSLKWVDEFLHYFTEYGIPQVLNVNSGTVLLGYWLGKLGIDIEFKISVFLGNDNPYSILWTLMTAKLFNRSDGTTPLVGLNLSNSVNNETIELTDYARNELGFEDTVRIEHHITEAYRNIVRQPYNRTDELVKLATHVKNISAKHEGGLPEKEVTKEDPSNILEYFVPKKDIIENGLMPKLLRDYLDKHEALNMTAKALTQQGLTVIAAPKLHSH